MCGIIGYVGGQPCQQLLLEGLRKLEYRGYDSAGIAWREGDMARCIRAVGNLNALEAVLARNLINGGATATQTVSAGIGHTRWATHGGVTEVNAHPHEDASGRFRIVLNGIIENHQELRQRLAGDLVWLRSDTDAEVVAHLIALNYDGSLSEAVSRSLDELQGHYAIVAMCEDEPDTLVGVRRECPLVLGLGEGEQFIASSISAFLAHTREVAVLSDGEIAVLRPDDVEVFDVSGPPRRPDSTHVDWDEERCDKDGYETFMLKEIHEQASAVRETLTQWRADVARNELGGLSADRLRQVKRIIIVGCGTSYHAGLAGRNAIERWARIPVDVEVASEFRYREPIIERGTLVLGISQSGETADTLAAMRLARTHGATVIAVTNAQASQATRDSDGALFTRAGLEIGVAATKTFVAQVVLLYELAIRLAAVTRSQPDAVLADLQWALDELPELIDQVVASVEQPIRELAQRLARSSFFLYLGRLSGVPVALEGALKLKEISYVPTDAYAAGEMKHGPIALLGPDTPVVCVATDRRVLPKLLSNLSEARARGAQVLAIATEGCTEIAEQAEHVIYIPDTDPLLQVVLGIVPLQLFAYHLARARGLNVDQPRNLAKTVTVE
ncbi:MAG: glutamine--fructose-6-phosphate transaminase (isomerizing) [Solirubrobacteraceae bacterium]